MANAEKFISLYKVLEDLLEEKCREEGRSTVNAVYQYISAMGNVRFRDKLDLCRQVRNLITHSADIGGRRRDDHQFGHEWQIRQARYRRDAVDLAIARIHQPDGPREATVPQLPQH